MNFWSSLALGRALVAAAFSLLLGAGVVAAEPRATIDQFPARLLNIGNALEAPMEGQWGLVVEEWFFEEIRSAGFQGIRLPIRWSAHAQAAPPYTIDPAFFARIDQVVDQASAQDLVVLLDLHHYAEMMANPGAHRDRFLALWAQIAAHYADRPSGIAFELLNEPEATISATFWNQLVADALAVIRPSNPDRIVVVGPILWNLAAGLPQLELPESDRNLLVTFHYYLPLQFTHQGAAWIAGSDAWLGTRWGTEAEREAVRSDFDAVAAWAQANDRPILLGEFGAYSAADMASRAAWTGAVRAEAEARGFAWAYWEFGSGFGAYDVAGREWIEPLYRALVPVAPPVPALGGLGVSILALGLLAMAMAKLHKLHRRARV